MNPNQTPSKGSSKIESAAYYIFLATLVLAPLAFWPSPYVALDLVKTIVISIGTLVSAILFGIVAIRERNVALPPRKIFWTSILLFVSLVASSLTSIHVLKSLFGQGFEIGTASFISIVFLAAFVAFTLVKRQSDRAVVLYTGIVVSYLILYVFHLLRVVFGPSFVSLTILTTPTSTVLGGWYGFGAYSVVVALISILAIISLPLSRRMKIAYWILAIISFVGVYIVGDSRVWEIMTLTFLAITIYRFVIPRTRDGSTILASGFFKRISWIPLVVFIIGAVFVWRGGSLIDPVINRINMGHSELSLPWQMTLDVTSGVMKNYPVLGVGPNHFTQAFLAYKPASINQTDAWGVEFGNGFGLIPTLVANQGFVGLILWILFFVFFIMSGIRVIRQLSGDAPSGFVAVSSFFVSVFLWAMAIVSVPSHALLVLTLIMTGIFFGSAESVRLLSPFAYSPRPGTKVYKLTSSFLIALIVIAVVWGLVLVKKTIALCYFSSGVKQLTVVSNAEAADKYFAKALLFDTSDVFWQGRAEAASAQARVIISGISSTMSEEDKTKAGTNVTNIINAAVIDAGNAIAYDPTNYYNHVSKARVAELASSVGLDKGYETAVDSYTQAITLNRGNPSLYLSLAKLQASKNNLDEALKTTGVALQVKGDYLDAIFILSQIYAAKGDLANAITASKLAVDLNPSSPLLYFQLGLLQYNNKNYSAAATALESAVKLQSDYANAQYFLGLSYARTGNISGAIKQFQDLAKTNPDNAEVGLVLRNLQAGKPIFTDALPPVTPNPEKRSSLPIKERK